MMEQERRVRGTLMGIVLVAACLISSAVAAESNRYVTKNVIGNFPAGHNAAVEARAVILDSAKSLGPCCTRSREIIFRSQVDYPMSYYTTGMTSADFDDNGLDDVFRVEPGGYFEIYLNDGWGGLVFHASGDLGTTWYANYSGSGDFDLDGDQDVIVSHAGTGTNPAGIFLLKGDGSGGISEFTLYQSPRPMFRTEVVDRDDDGDLDVIAATQTNSGEIIYFENDGRGNLTASAHDLGVSGLFPMDVEVFGSTLTSEPPKLVVVGSTGMFAPGGYVLVVDLDTFTVDAQYYLGGAFDPEICTVADINQDGYPDLLATHRLNDVLIMLGENGGTFQPYQIHNFPTDYRLLEVKAVNLPALDRARVLIANGDYDSPVMAIMTVYSDPLETLNIKDFVGAASGTGGRQIIFNNLNGDTVPDLVLRDNGGWYGQSFSTLLGALTPLRIEIIE